MRIPISSTSTLAAFESGLVSGISFADSTAFGGDRRSLERIQRDIDLRSGTGADFLTNIEHRCFITLALAYFGSKLVIELIIR